MRHHPCIHHLCSLGSEALTCWFGATCWLQGRVQSVLCLRDVPEREEAVQRQCGEQTCGDLGKIWPQVFAGVCPLLSSAWTSAGRHWGSRWTFSPMFKKDKQAECWLALFLLKPSKTAPSKIPDAPDLFLDCASRFSITDPNPDILCTFYLIYIFPPELRR